MLWRLSHLKWLHFFSMEGVFTRFSFYKKEWITLKTKNTMITFKNIFNWVHEENLYGLECLFLRYYRGRSPYMGLIKNKGEFIWF